MEIPIVENVTHVDGMNSVWGIDVFDDMFKRGSIKFDPRYQRGDVWGYTRRVNLLRSIYERLPIGTIILNDRLEASEIKNSDWSDTKAAYAIIDGKQRLTTILMWIYNHLGLPGAWFKNAKSKLVYFKDLPEGVQRRFMNKSIPILRLKVPTLTDEVNVFNRINFGGVIQGDIDPQPFDPPAEFLASCNQ